MLEITLHCIIGIDVRIVIGHYGTSEFLPTSRYNENGYHHHHLPDSKFESPQDADRLRSVNHDPWTLLELVGKSNSNGGGFRDESENQERTSPCSEEDAWPHHSVI